MPSFGPSPLGAQGDLARSMTAGQPAPMQQSPLSSNFAPNLVVPPPPQLPNKSPMSAMSPALQAAMQRGSQSTQTPPAPQQNSQQVTLPVQDQNQQQPGIQVPISEAELIIKAMTERLKHTTKMEAHSSYAAPQTEV